MNNIGFGGSGGSSNNPYLDKSVGDALGDSTKAYNMSTAPAYTSAMVRSGSFGNSGLAQAQDESNRQFQTAQGRQANDMRSNNYQFGQSLGNNQYQFDQNMDRGVYNDTFNQNQQNYQNGMNLLGTQNQYNTQNLGFGTQVQNAPQGYYQGFSNSANSIGNGYGTQSGTSSAQGNPLLGAMGGAQLGGAMSRNLGFGSSSGSEPYPGYNKSVGLA